MTHSATRHAPVSVDDLCDPPERVRATISPDGRRIAFLAPWRTRLHVWVAEIGEDGDVDLDRIDLAEIDVATGELALLAEADGALLGWMVTARREVYGQVIADAVFSDEGHVFVNPENLETMVVETGRFLAEHLGGRP